MSDHKYKAACTEESLQRAEIDIDYMDSLSLSLSTSVLINFPRPRFAVLPVALGVELVSIGGTVSAAERFCLECQLKPNLAQP